MPERAVSHENDLERRYDGHIPDALRQAARRRDDARPAPDYVPPPPRFTRPRSARGCVAPMAALLMARVAAHGACTEADLAGAGFTAAEIAIHGEAARAAARRAVADAA